MTEVGDNALGMFTVPEAAARMSLGKRTVWRMIHDGEIESVKRGRSRRIPRQAVADYIEQLRTASGSPASSGAEKGTAA
jgi:excisionase family DNA binding protein